MHAMYVKEFMAALGTSNRLSTSPARSRTLPVLSVENTAELSTYQVSNIRKNSHSPSKLFSILKNNLRTQIVAMKLQDMHHGKVTHCDWQPCQFDGNELYPL